MTVCIFAILANGMAATRWPLPTPHHSTSVCASPFASTVAIWWRKPWKPWRTSLPSRWATFFCAVCPWLWALAGQKSAAAKPRKKSAAPSAGTRLASTWSCCGSKKSESTSCIPGTAVPPMPNRAAWAGHRRCSPKTRRPSPAPIARADLQVLSRVIRREFSKNFIPCRLGGSFSAFVFCRLPPGSLFFNFGDLWHSRRYWQSR